MCEWGNERVIRVKVVADLSHSGKSFFKDIGIDLCISSTVEALQVGGIDMRSSCCGHNRGDGEIVLQDGRILRIE